MEISWFLLAFIATLLWAIVSITIKFVRVNYIKSPIGYLMITTPTTLFSLVFLLFDKFQMPSLKMIIFILISSISGLVGYWFYLVAIHKEEISRVTTLFGLTPLATLILATLFLNEKLTINEYLAFPLIMIGSMLISLKKEKKKFKLSFGFTLIFISIFLFSIQTTLLKLVEQLNFVTLMIIREFSFIALLVPLYLLSKKIREKTKDDLNQLNKKKLSLIYVAECTGLIGLVFCYSAIQKGPVSLVSLINGTEGLFVIVLAALMSIFIPKILKEEINKKVISLKIISAVLMIIGLYLITI